MELPSQPEANSSEADAGETEVSRAKPLENSLRKLAVAARTLIARPLRLWRRSIQFRVVVSVIALSAVVTGFIGLQLIDQITDGLVANRAKAAVAEASTEKAVTPAAHGI